MANTVNIPTDIFISGYTAYRSFRLMDDALFSLEMWHAYVRFLKIQHIHYSTDSRLPHDKYVIEPPEAADRLNALLGPNGYAMYKMMLARDEDANCDQ